MREPIFLIPFFECKIIHVKAKRKLTLLITSCSDFVSAT